MYCEIRAEHRKPVKAEGLKAAVQELFRNELQLEKAYQKSALYSIEPPSSSVCAFELVGNCFVILRKVGLVRFSTYHVEGDGRSVSVDTMLQAVQEFSGQLLRELGRDSQFKLRNLTAQLFEDNGRETRLEGRIVTLSSMFKEKFAWRELAPAVIAFATALLLIWQVCPKSLCFLRLIACRLL